MGVYWETSHTKIKQMDFKLHQLSPSNLASIFNSAYFDAQVTEDNRYCLLNEYYQTYVWILEEQKTINYFYNGIFPEELEEEKIKFIVNKLNLSLGTVKAYYFQEKIEEKTMWMIAFKYEHIILNHESIDPKSLIKLFRIFERKIDASLSIYSELCKV